MRETDEKEIMYRKKIEESDDFIAKKTLSKEYQENLSLFSKKYLDILSNIEQNREDIYIIIHKIIEEIIVISRPVTEKTLSPEKIKRTEWSLLAFILS